MKLKPSVCASCIHLKLCAATTGYNKITGNQGCASHRKKKKKSKEVIK